MIAAPLERAPRGGWPERGAFVMTDQDDLLRRAAHALPGGLLGNHRSGAGLEFVDVFDRALAVIAESP